MRNRESIKLFLTLTICTFYIFAFSHYGVDAIETFFYKNGSYESGTSIGSVDVSGKSDAEAAELVKALSASWLKKSTFQLHYKEKSIEFDNELFLIDIDKSINQAKQGRSNPLIIGINSLGSFLSGISGTLTTSVLDIESLKEDLIAKARYLEIGNYDINLQNYMIASEFNKESTISESNIKPNDNQSEIAFLVEKMPQIKLEPKSQFSFNEQIKELGIKKLSPDTLSAIATGIYEAILPTNFSIIERQTSKSLPKFSELGYEARINLEKDMDLVFTNPNDSTYTIILDWNKNRIKVDLKGSSFLYRYNVIKKDKQSFKPKTIVQFNPQLKLGQKTVEKEGKEGMLIRVQREIYDEKGKKIKTESISEDFYPPIHRVEVHPLIVEKASSTNQNNDSEPENQGDTKDEFTNDESDDSSSTNNNQDDSK